MQGAIPAANAAALMGDTAASARASRSLPNVPPGFNWLAFSQGLAPPEQLLTLQEVRSGLTSPQTPKSVIESMPPW